MEGTQPENASANSLPPEVMQAPQAPAAPPMRLGDKLVALGLISKDQLEIALKEQKASQVKKMLGAILVEMGFVTESALGEVLAENAGTERFDPAKAVLDSVFVRKLPKELASRHKVIPIIQKGNTIILGMADVYNVLAIDQVRKYFPKHLRIEPMYCNESDIVELIGKYYEYETSIEGILKEIETGIKDKKKLDGEKEGYVNPTVRLVNAFLVDAIMLSASDIHFEPEGNFLRLRYRIDGEMQQIRSLHKDYWSAISVRIKIMAGMNIAEVRMPQDGRITYNVMGREVDFRVATQPTIHGENIVMRLLDKKKALLPLQQLGFSDHNEQLLKKLLKRPEGIIIVTGPTGSGKTTTLYSILGFINNDDVNIMTLEDPVEYQLPMIRQSNVREGSGMSFSEGIKSVLRQDPDIIFIGEVRDQQTASMSIRAAMTGHKVFTTLHTNDALGVIPRLTDIGVTGSMMAGSLVCAIAQRLARKLCPHCKEPHTPDAEECKILGADPANPPKIFKAKGCIMCGNKGYKGRTAMVEILPIDKDMDELIAMSATRNKMMEHALKMGFKPMVHDGIRKVLEGTMDVAELVSSVDITDRL